MSELIYGSLKPLANVGQAGIKTSGAYIEPVARVNHAEKLMQELRESSKYGGGGRYSKPTYKLDTVLINKRRKELGITQTGIYKKMKLSTTTFYNAINGGRVQIHCVERFAELLGLTEEELIIKDGEK